jgi:hypothetical protein
MTIQTVMNDALTALETLYAAEGVELPDRRYWTIGEAAADCEQAVFAVQQVFIGIPGAPSEPTRCDGPRSITFSLQILRCVPVANARGNAPEAAAIQEASVLPTVDMELMLDLAPAFDPMNLGVVVFVDVISANGGFHGAVATYTVSM